VIVRTGKCISSQSAATSLRLVVIHNKYPVLDAAEGEGKVVLSYFNSKHWARSWSRFLGSQPAGDL